MAGIRKRCKISRLIFASYLLFLLYHPMRIRATSREFTAETRSYSIVMANGEDTACVGLCAACRNMRLIKSDRGSVFYFCQLSASDARFPKYPRLPVLKCAGYEKISTAEAQRRGENQSGS